ncbi:MAG: hypothetical protein AB8G22_18355 [Saprospiraceae bacterium]
MQCHQPASPLQAALTSSTAEQPNKNNRETLFKKIYEQRAITLIYPAAIPEYQPLLEQIASNSRWLKINLLPSNEVKKEDLQQTIFYLLGTPKSNPIIKELLPELPLTVSSDHIGNDQYQSNKEDVVITTSVYPNPNNAQLPMSLMTGRSDEAIIALIHHLQRQGGWRLVDSFGYEIYENNRRVLVGNFNETNWKTATPAFDFTQTGAEILVTDNYRFLCENCTVDSLLLNEYAAQLEANHSEILTFSRVKTKKNPNHKLNVHLYLTAETKGLLTGNTERSHFNLETNEVHTVLNEIYREHELGEENIYWLRQWLKQPKTSALERGLAIHKTDRWQRKGYHYWAVRLYTSGNLPKLTNLLNNEYFQNGSDLVLHGSAASFVDYLILEWEEAGFLVKYTNWQPTEIEINQLEKGWHKHLEKWVLNYQDDKKRQPEMPFCKGFNFAHEGYRIYNGYGSQLATQSLEKMNNLGVNSIAIVPYSYQRDPRKATPIPLVQSAGNENDEAVVHSAYAARQLGQTTMLKPQIWLGRGEWPGSIEMANKEDWQQWMNYYHDWILHYALLAEIHEMEIFCLGVEFVNATTQNPELWRHLIQQIRGVYSGYLTYAANWGEEFQNVNFWKELDYIGLNCYYPLSKADNPTQKDLMNGFAAIKKKIEKVTTQYNKPLLFTEIGFRSIDTPWKNPHAEANGANANEMHQKVAYEVVYESIKNEAWCEGIYWWKFPTYLDYQGKDNTSFTPNNKATEAVIQQYWKK